MTDVQTKYKSSEGWHVFYSDELPGLYVANKDIERAYNDVGPCIEMLLKLDKGIECKVSPELPFQYAMPSEHRFKVEAK